LSTERLTKNWETDLLQVTLPRWDELPDMDIYMDQLVKYVDKYTYGLQLEHTKKLTPSMINNYVKLKLVPKPYKKKYSKNHLARIIVITVLKQAFEIPDIRNGIVYQIHSTDPKDAYDFFCHHLEMTIKYFINENKEDINIDKIKDGYAPVQMACTTFIAKLITENNLRDLVSKTTAEEK
jgi:DNA-binding transcriptional MerR regulator